MSFSHEWEDAYKANRSGSVWPWSALVSYVMRYAQSQGKKLKVLELGCGGGANIPFFQSVDTDYYAIEGSSTMVNKLHTKFPSLKQSIVVADFTREIPFTEIFDLIVDRASLTHNNEAAIKHCIHLVKNKLRDGGKFIGVDWFSTMHSDYILGDAGEDMHTRSHVQQGQFAKLGRVHFSDKQHILDLFKDFTLEVMEHKISYAELPIRGHVLASWDFVAIKKD